MMRAVLKTAEKSVNADVPTDSFMNLLCLVTRSNQHNVDSKSMLVSDRVLPAGFCLAIIFHESLKTICQGAALRVLIFVAMFN